MLTEGAPNTVTTAPIVRRPAAPNRRYTRGAPGVPQSRSRQPATKPGRSCAARREGVDCKTPSRFPGVSRQRRSAIAARLGALKPSAMTDRPPIAWFARRLRELLVHSFLLLGPGLVSIAQAQEKVPNGPPPTNSPIQVVAIQGTNWWIAPAGAAR